MDLANATRLNIGAEMMQEKLYRENLIKLIEADRLENMHANKPDFLRTRN